MLDCNCSVLPDFYTNLSTKTRTSLYDGLDSFPAHLKSQIGIDLNENCELLTEPSSDPALCKCKACGQYWAVELAPDENLYEILAVKLTSAEQFQSFDIQPIKMFLTLLAFGGFGQSKCLFQGCDEYVLGRTNLCLKHHGVLNFF
jgi:hypothetical protein